MQIWGRFNLKPGRQVWPGIRNVGGKRRWKRRFWGVGDSNCYTGITASQPLRSLNFRYYPTRKGKEDNERRREIKLNVIRRCRKRRDTRWRVSVVGGSAQCWMLHEGNTVVVDTRKCRLVRQKGLQFQIFFRRFDQPAAAQHVWWNVEVGDGENHTKVASALGKVWVVRLAIIEYSFRCMSA